MRKYLKGLIVRVLMYKCIQIWIYFVIYFSDKVVRLIVLKRLVLCLNEDAKEISY